jgi:hypothetical protein
LAESSHPLFEQAGGSEPARTRIDLDPSCTEQTAHRLNINGIEHYEAVRINAAIFIPETTSGGCHG